MPPPTGLDSSGNVVTGIVSGGRCVSPPTFNVSADMLAEELYQEDVQINGMHATFGGPDGIPGERDELAAHFMEIARRSERTYVLTFGSLNTLQLTGGLPYYQPPSYIQSIRQHHPSSHQHSDLDERDSPMQSISPPLTSMSTSDLSGADSSNNALPPYLTTAGTAQAPPPPRPPMAALPSPTHNNLHPPPHSSTVVRYAHQRRQQGPPWPTRLANAARRQRDNRPRRPSTRLETMILRRMRMTCQCRTRSMFPRGARRCASSASRASRDDATSFATDTAG